MKSASAINIALLMLGLMTSFPTAAWSPSDNPDPQAILSEARADTGAGRYEDALAKHLWFHRHALEVDRAFYGVRLSFALAFWLEFAEKYPPAMTALRSVRDEAESRVRNGSQGQGDFIDVAAINDYLNDRVGTTKLFMWLDKNDPKLARRIYPRAQAALIESRQYALCGRYIDSVAMTYEMLALYRQHSEMAKSGQRQDVKDIGEKSLINGASTLVALLVLNKREAEADAVIDKVMAEWPDKLFKAQLQKARKGMVPTRWPPQGR